jgi:phosphatidylinositol N-acetylglucosaminyltransferase subunit P
MSREQASEDSSHDEDGPGVPASSTTTISSNNTSSSNGEVEEDADFQSQYSIDHSSSGDSSESEDLSPEKDGIAMHRPFMQSTGSLSGPNAFAPPFYNRPPTPLPPSPSLTSLLRPPFSTTTSRPTTPDTSDAETPNDTEAAVAKSARNATTVPRASPKVPTYEYYGFVLYLASSLAFCKFTLSNILGITPVSDHFHNSDILIVVVFTLPISAPAGNILLPESLVVTCHPILPRDDDCVHICGSGVI